MPFFLLSQTIRSGFEMVACEHIGIIEAPGVREIAAILGGEIREAEGWDSKPTGVLERDRLETKALRLKNMEKVRERFGEEGDAGEFLREMAEDWNRIEIQNETEYSLGDVRERTIEEDAEITYIFLPLALFTIESRVDSENWFQDLTGLTKFEREYVWSREGRDYRFGYLPLKGPIRWVVLGEWGGPRWRESAKLRAQINALLGESDAELELWDKSDEELLKMWDSFREWTTDMVWQQRPEEEGVYVECRELPTVSLKYNDES